MTFREFIEAEQTGYSPEQKSNALLWFIVNTLGKDRVLTILESERFDDPLPETVLFGWTESEGNAIIAALEAKDVTN